MGQPDSYLAGDPSDRATVIVPNVKIAHQFTGKSGNDTFRRFLGDIDVTAHDSRHLDASGRIVVSTPGSTNGKYQGLRLVGPDRNELPRSGRFVQALSEPRFANAAKRSLAVCKN